ncbi:hypothetical protein HYE04_00915 [Mycoplasmopsis bovis]|nr:hypothetical protein HYE04_00915 [Mycoplasmopsis bovis]
MKQDNSKRLENNSNAYEIHDIFKFYKQLLYFYLKNRNSFNLDRKLLNSVASIIFKYKETNTENFKIIYPQFKTFTDIANIALVKIRILP